MADLLPIAVQPIQLSYVSLAGDQVPAATRENVHLLQHAADYEICFRNLKRSGIGDMIWGLICCALGVAFYRLNPLNAGLVALGLILIGVGFWITFHPSPIGMVVDGIALLIVAAWNLMIYAMAISHARSGPMLGNGLIIAFAQIFWGIHRLQQYPRFATAVAMHPSDATMGWLRELVNATLKIKPKQDPTAIEFTRRGWLSYEKWKGRLMPEMAILAMRSGNFGGRRDALLASQDGIVIVSRTKKLLRARFKVEMQVRDREIKVMMPTASLQKLDTWLQRSPFGAAPLANMNIRFGMSDEGRG